MRLILVVCCLAVATLATDSASSENEIKVEVSIPSVKEGTETKNTLSEKEVVIELSFPKFLRHTGINKEKVKQSQHNVNNLKDKWFGKKKKGNKEEFENEKEDKCNHDSHGETQSKQKLERNKDSVEEQDQLGIEVSKEPKTIWKHEKEDILSSEEISYPETKIDNYEIEKKIRNKQRLAALKEKWLGKSAKLQAGLEVNKNLKMINDNKNDILELLRLAETDDLDDVLEDVAKDIEIEESLMDKLNIAKTIILPSEGTIEIDINTPKLNTPVEVDQLREKLKRVDLKTPKLKVGLDLEEKNVEHIKPNCTGHVENLTKLPRIENAYKLDTLVKDKKQELLKSRKGKWSTKIPTFEVELGKINLKDLNKRLPEKKINLKQLVDISDLGALKEDLAINNLNLLPELKNESLGKNRKLEINQDIKDQEVSDDKKENLSETENQPKSVTENSNEDVQKDSCNHKSENIKSSINISNGKEVDNVLSTEEISKEFNIPNLKKPFDIKFGKARRTRPNLKALKKKWLNKKSKLGIELGLDDKATWEEIQNKLAKIDFENLTDVEDLEELKEELNNLKDYNDDLVAKKTADNIDRIENNNNDLPSNKNIADVDSNSVIDVEINIPDLKLPFSIKGGKARRNRPDLKALKEKLLKKKSKLGIELNLDDKATLEEIEEKLAEIDLDKLTDIGDLEDLKEELNNLKDHSYEFIPENDIRLKKKNGDGLPNSEIDIDINIPDLKLPFHMKGGKSRVNRPDLKALKEKLLKKKSKLGIELSLDDKATLEEIEEKLAEIGLDKLTDIEDLEDMKEELNNLKDHSYELVTENDIRLKKKNGDGLSNPEIDVDINIPGLKLPFHTKGGKARRNRPDLKALKEKLLKKKSKLGIELSLDDKATLEEIEEKLAEIDLEKLPDIEDLEELKEELNNLKDLSYEFVTENDIRLKKKNSDGISNSEIDIDINIPDLKLPFHIKGGKTRRNRPDLKALKEKLLKKKSKLGIELSLDDKATLEEIEDKLAEIDLDKLPDIEDLKELKEELNNLKDHSSEFVTENDIRLKKRNSDGISNSEIDIDINIPDLKLPFHIKSGKTRRNRPDLKALKEKLLKKKSKLGIELSLDDKATLEEIEEKLAEIDLDKLPDSEDLEELKEELNNLKDHSYELVTENDIRLKKKNADGISNSEIDIDINIPDLKLPFHIKGGKARRNRPDLKALKEKLLKKKSKLGIELSLDDKATLEEIEDKLAEIDLDKLPDIEDLEELKEELNNLKNHNNDLGAEETADIKYSIKNNNDIHLKQKNADGLSNSEIDININIPDLKLPFHIKSGNVRRIRPDLKALKEKLLKKKSKLGIELSLDDEATLKEIEEKLAEIDLGKLTDTEDLEELKEELHNLKDHSYELVTEKKADIIDKPTQALVDSIPFDIKLQNLTGQFDIEVKIPNIQHTLEMKDVKARRNSPQLKALKNKWIKKKPKKSAKTDNLDAPNNIEIVVPDFKQREIWSEKDSDELEDFSESKEPIKKLSKKRRLIKLKEIVAKKISKGKLTLEKDLDQLKEELENKINKIIVDTNKWNTSSSIELE